VIAVNDFTFLVIIATVVGVLMYVFGFRNGHAVGYDAGRKDEDEDE